MAMGKPWEETWTFDMQQDVVWTDLDDMRSVGEPVLRPGAESSGDQLRLAAAAPDLVRALLAVELAPGRVPGVDEECPWCGSIEGQTHAADCPRQAALRKAGVLK